MSWNGKEDIQGIFAKFTFTTEKFSVMQVLKLVCSGTNRMIGYVLITVAAM
jgi:hypothetical protein